MREWTGFKLVPFSISKGDHWKSEYAELNRFPLYATNYEDEIDSNKSRVRKTCEAHAKTPNIELPYDEDDTLKTDYVGQDGRFSFHMEFAIPEQLWRELNPPQFNEYGEICP